MFKITMQTFSWTLDWPQLTDSLAALTPDITPFNFFLWGFVKDRVYATKLCNINEIRRRIEAVIQEITPDMINNVQCKIEYYHFTCHKRCSCGNFWTYHVLWIKLFKIAFSINQYSCKYNEFLFFYSPIKCAQYKTTWNICYCDIQNSSL